VVVNKKKLEMDKLGKFYQNKVIIEPLNVRDSNNYLLTVQNDRGQTVSIESMTEKNPF
jgi:hypothetical protein